jgi:hypothetical protein
MYGPPPFCKRRMKMTELVCANVFGLYWSSELSVLLQRTKQTSVLVAEKSPSPQYRERVTANSEVIPKLGYVRIAHDSLRTAQTR